MRKPALRALSEAFHGRLARTVDWLGLLELANAALVTPALHQALARSGHKEAIPDDVAAFMAEVTARNAERNARLMEQAADAIGALNSAGVTPALLKGGAILATCNASGPYPRMMSDVDLLVRPDQVETAMGALQTAGFGISSDHRGENLHAVADLCRQGDVGMLDLHQRAPGPRAAVEGLLSSEAFVPVRLGGSALAPPPTLQVFLLCIHDLFHDGGFWRGGFDLRHLCDIAALVSSDNAVDWEKLESLLTTRLLRNAVHSQLIAAWRIANADIPASIHRRWAPRLHYHRHLAQSLHPAARLPLVLAGMVIEAPNLLQHGRRFPRDSHPTRNRLDRLWRMGKSPAHTSKV